MSRTHALLFLLPLLAGPADAGESAADRILLRARCAEQVQGDLEKARGFYKQALADRSLDEVRQAEIRVRIAYCLVHGAPPRDNQALGYLHSSIYRNSEIPERVRIEAERLRETIRARRPATADAPTPTRDRDREIARRVAGHLAEARRHLARDHLFLAFVGAHKALGLAPEDPDALALEAQIRTRLDRVAALLDSPLAFLKSWSAAQVKTVARRARAHLRTALAAYRTRKFKAGESAFLEAITEIDSCEFGDASTELIDLRETIHEQWRALREQHYGKQRAEPRVPVRAPRGTPAADYLRQLQRMLDFLSSTEHEYRLIPVTPGRVSVSPRGQVPPPRGFVLERHPTPSRWTLARFAHLYLPRHIEPRSWTTRGNFLDTAGAMLVARNRPDVLDKLQREIKLLEAPTPGTITCEFVLISIPDDALRKFAGKFGPLRNMGTGEDPMLGCVVPPEIPLERICGWLTDENVEVHLDRDRFELRLPNGRSETLLAGRPIEAAHGYRKERLRAAPPYQRNYGVLLDMLPWQRDGATSLALRIAVRQPIPPVPTDRERTVPRFLTQSLVGYADLAPGATLAIAGLVDPFARARGERGGGGSLLVLLHMPSGRRTAPATAAADALEIDIKRLLYDVHKDDAGPVVDAEKGFVPISPLAGFENRARFLEARMREIVPDVDLDFDWEAAVVRVRAAHREAVEGAVAALEQDARRVYVVDLEARAVSTSAFQRWMRRENVATKAWGKAELAVVDAESGATVLRNLPAAQKNDPFTPRSRWVVLGLQARHMRATRSRTVAAAASEEWLASGAVETVTEGVRITVRPYLVGGQEIRADISVETAGLAPNSDTNASKRAAPLTVVGASGTVVFGTRTRPKTVLVCRIPHPTASRPGELIEVVFALNIRLQ